MTDKCDDDSFKAMEEEMSRFEQEIADVTAKLPKPPPLDFQDVDERISRPNRGGPYHHARPPGPPMRPSFIPHQVLSRHSMGRLPPPPPPPGNNEPMGSRGLHGPMMGPRMMGPRPMGMMGPMGPNGPPPPPGSMGGPGPMMGPGMPQNMGPGPMGPGPMGPGPMGPGPMGHGPMGPGPMGPGPMGPGPMGPGPMGPGPMGPGPMGPGPMGPGPMGPGPMGMGPGPMGPGGPMSMGPIGPMMPGMMPLPPPQQAPSVIAKLPTTYSAKPVKFKTKKLEKKKKKKAAGDKKKEPVEEKEDKKENPDKTSTPETLKPRQLEPPVIVSEAAPPTPQIIAPAIQPDPMMQPQYYQQFQGTQMSEETREPPQKKQKKKKMLRTAAGTVWEDDSLQDWDSNDFRMFCGDLGNEISDESLAKVFGRYPTFLKAKVVRDKRTNKSKGFGFVSFKDPNDFVQAMKDWNGKYIGNRPIKLRKSTWKERNVDVAKKKQKEKERLGLR